ncbi:MAG: hypothetical protein AAFX06_18690 [Planctomycetota bacterium]
MESFFPSIWNVLHDGGVDRIVGSVPGEVRVHVGIEYLRERFPDDGDEFVVCLLACSRLSHRLYDDENSITDMEAIANLSATILSAEMDGAVCRVFTDLGVLEMECRGGRVFLDSGRPIPLTELLSVAEAYWDEWESKSKGRK